MKIEIGDNLSEILWLLVLCVLLPLGLKACDSKDGGRGTGCGTTVIVRGGAEVDAGK